jgi:phospholipase/carboxylesterase
MKYTRHETERDVVLSPATAPSASVLVLHGLGADGWDFVPIVQELHLPDSLPVRFVFPHAPVRPITVNNGYEMRGWYDIRDFSITGREDVEGMTESADRISGYVRREGELGVPPERVVLAGFSQGGAVALHTGLRYPERLGGIVALSTYLPFRSRVEAEISQTNRDVPILMCHGRHDSVVSYELGETSRDVLRDHGYEVEWHAFPFAHEVSLDEITLVAEWLRKTLA